MLYSVLRRHRDMHHLRCVFTKEKEEKAKFKLESKEKLKDEKKEKTKEKDKEKVKEKEKDKVKEKDKDKKDKKLTKVPSTVTSGVPFEEIFTLGVALPIFGVPLQQSVERSRCHDDTGLPLVVRDSIDFLQAHGIKSTQIYRSDADKIKLQQLRKLYTDRGPTFPYHWDVPVACAMLKTFISELPESILTQELHGQFEQSTAMAEPQRQQSVRALVDKLPGCSRSVLGWLATHFQSVVANEQVNHVNIQTICGVMGAALNMSPSLLSYFITKADVLFPEVRLTKYVPPLQSLPTEFPDAAPELSAELRKQESLLSQLHAEMHAGFITAVRDHQLWEAQRIVTQLKRRLRAVQKSVEPPAAESQPTKPPPQSSIEDKTEPVRRNSQQTDTQTQEEATSVKTTPDAFQDIVDSPKQDPTFEAEFEDNFDFTETKANEPEIVEKPILSEKEMKLLRLQLENAEYLQLKSLLQAKINSEQFEIVKLRSHVALKSKQEGIINKENKENYSSEEQELRQRLMKENALLEQKRLGLINQIFQERVACVQLKIELAMKEVLSKS
ncbi:ralA-binding protein 1 isoform X2 [Plodia interpunctella]|uniref:ralA-binding protein 1 isoform X2 n=1 Tax=Plodia interpunctella TaxID=58824 RepID=UPI002368751A|nr:ralA-binding protein 1 isoform X2 [Plodia interpunctella]